jgi:serine/threonine protein kinase
MDRHDANDLRDAPTLSNATAGQGPDETVTLQQTIRTGPGSLRSEPISGSDSERYKDTQRMLGAGGMGTIELVRDEKIGREVALKLMAKHSRDDSAARARFLREARIQGCLEHPAIVPVYDMGAGDDGPFFTMKRVRGQSLSQVFRAMRDGKRVAFSRRKLLDTLSQVAVAAHYAHDRGVVHRDIKPANIMLGPYGEVYLIDWGVAKVLGEDEELGQTSAHGQLTTSATEHGEVIGSLVTMAPEQVTGGAVDARTDVYALGAVLFELLTLQPLHPRGSFEEVAQAIVAGVDARPSVRTPEANVPPELEALCVAATRRVPSERTASALAFSEAIEAFLDSENDEQLRRRRSEEHAARGKHYAEQAMTIAPSRDDNAGTHEASLRSNALREVGRALALNPSNHAALSTFVQLITTPPRVVPEEVRLAQPCRAHKAAQDRWARHHGFRGRSPELWTAAIPSGYTGQPVDHLCIGAVLRLGGRGPRHPPAALLRSVVRKRSVLPRRLRGGVDGNGDLYPSHSRARGRTDARLLDGEPTLVPPRGPLLRRRVLDRDPLRTVVGSAAHHSAGNRRGSRLAFTGAGVRPNVVYPLDVRIDIGDGVGHWSQRGGTAIQRAARSRSTATAGVATPAIGCRRTCVMPRHLR